MTALVSDLAFKRTGSQGSTSGRALVPVLLACTWLLTGPRVDIASVGGTGVRLEDAIFVALFAYVAQHGLSLVNRTHLRALSWALIASMLSVIAAIAANRVSPLTAILYTLRPYEYWIILPALLCALHSARDAVQSEAFIRRTLGFVTLAQTSVAALQFAGVPLGFSKFSIERSAGLTAGPYELGAIGAMLACYWLAQRHTGLMLLSITAVILSQSRISLVATLVGLVAVTLTGAREKARFRKPNPIYVVIATAGIIVGTIFILPNLPSVVSPTADRVAETSLTDSWQRAHATSSAVSAPHDTDEYLNIAFTQISQNVISESDSSDTSNVVRFFRWQVLGMAIGADALAATFGLGPSFAGPSVDGGIFRVFIETGIFGICTWIAWMLTALKGSARWLGSVLLSIMVGAVFIDINFALRPMVLFWLMAAVANYSAYIRGSK